MIPLTKEIVLRVMCGRHAFSDPCVICGERFNSKKCNHSVLDTEPVIKRVKRMSKKEREKIINA